MTRRGLLWAAGVLVSFVLVPLVSGCGGADNSATGVEDVKPIATVNPTPDSVPVEEEYKSMQKAAKKAGS